MTNVDWRKYIVSTPEVLRGKPRSNGTRIPVSLVLACLAAGSSVEEIIEEYPDLDKQKIAACLNYARDLAEFEVSSAAVTPSQSALEKDWLTSEEDDAWRDL